MGTEKAGTAPLRQVAVETPVPTTDLSIPDVSVHERRSGRWTVVTVAGEMDMQVFGLLPDLRSSTPVHAVFDLHRVTFIDASGLNALVLCHNQAAATGGCLRILAPSAAVRQLLALTGTDVVFTPYCTLDAAISAPVDTRPATPQGTRAT